MRALSHAHTSLQTHPKVLGAFELRGSRALIRGLSRLSHSRFWIESLNKECVFPWHQTWLTGGDLGPDHAECVQLAWGSGEPKGELCGLFNGSGQKYWKNLPGISREALFCFQVCCFFFDQIVDLSLSTNKQHNFFPPCFSSSCVRCHHKLKEQVCQFISLKENLMMLLAFLLQADVLSAKRVQRVPAKNDVLAAFKTQGVGGSLAACQTLTAHRTSEEKEPL